MDKPEDNKATDTTVAVAPSICRSAAIKKITEWTGIGLGLAGGAWIVAKKKNQEIADQDAPISHAAKVEEQKSVQSPVRQ